jgi:signal transduction histidine kinase/ActR/RegA family two-component response regulator
MFGWGIMGMVLANLSVCIPGTEVGISGLGEIAAISGVAFLSSWQYALGLALLVACGGPYDDSLTFTFFMHIITIPATYFLYHGVVKKIQSSIVNFIATFTMVILVYVLIFGSTFTVATLIFNSLSPADIPSIYIKFLAGVKFEAFLTAIITTLICAIKFNADKSLYDFNYLQVALQSNVIRTMWRLDQDDKLTFFTNLDTITSLFGKNSCSLDEFYHSFIKYANREKYHQLKNNLEIMRKGLIKQFELVYLLSVPGRAEKWVLIKGVIDKKEPDGTAKTILGFSIDVTDYHNTLEKNKKLQDQLLQTQKMQSIGLLAGGIAHDFNNLLTIINGYADILKDEIPSDNDELRSCAEGIGDAGKKASKLTSQLLAFSRKQIYDPKSVNLNVIITNLEKMLTRLINEDIQINLQLAKNIKLIEADTNQLEQILINLVLNARDAINDVPEIKDKKITIKTENILVTHETSSKYFERAAGEYVLLSVCDNGSGMSKEVLEHIFEPFFTTKGKEVGTGLGMSTVYGIVQQNNGFLDIESQEGRGTTVTINWSVSQTAMGGSTTDKHKILPSGEESLLLVEDNEELKKFTTLSIQKLGYKVRNAADGVEALQILKEGYRPQMVLTDVVMPKMDGYELSKALREKYPDIKILFMSGYTDNDIVNNGQIDSNIHFLQKPYTIKQLSNIIREILEENKDNL